MAAPAPPPLRVSAAPAGGWTVVTVTGELDHVTCPELTARLNAVICDGRRPQVAVDLSGLEFCDSSGLRSLIMAWNRARGRAGDLVLVLPPDARLRTRLRQTGLDTVLPVGDELPAR